ncbi:unnamed protein product [Rotaria sp. Silwood1]|nr:unnamed protein product [Rotaria sp. Silwood1]
MKRPQFIHKNPYSFVLADGVAPFQVLGTIELSIQFVNMTTTIQAHIARNLCADMILGMDYINKYNLNIDVKQQTIAIEYNNRILTMNIDQDFELHKIPVTSSKAIYIPPHSNRSSKVSIPISSVYSSFVPCSHLKYNTPSIITQTCLNFQNYCSSVILSNTSAYPRFIRKGVCVGFLFCGSLLKGSQIPAYSLNKSFGVTGYSGKTPASHGSDIDEIASGQESFGVNGSSGKTPVACDSDTYNIDYYKTHKFPNKHVFCNTVKSLNPVVEEHIRTIAQKINNKQQQDQLYSLLVRFHRTFDVAKHNIANTPINHVINTIPHSPPACRPYPQPNTEEAMYKLVQEFLQAGLIQESHSPYAAPAILVKKKDGSFRFVVDYKKLNLITIKDSSPLPNMEDTIRKLGQGYSYFSKLDLKSGFYQIPIDEGDKEKTAFVTPFGLYQFNVLPMGLKNSPPTFQKVMTSTLQCCRQFALVYLDDIIVFSKSYPEHLYHLDCVLTALQAKSLVLNPPKCDIAVRKIDYLGHTISQYRITPMKDKITAILQIEEPRSLAQANKFVGGLGWYRKFLPHFATVAAPIHAVTNLTKRKRHKFRWQFAQSRAFQELKRMLITEPLFLHYPVDDKPLILTTDASGIGVGGVLQQEVNGEMHNLYYHSQLMTQCERNYSAIEKEALAIYKCFDRMRSFLLGRNIIVMTDHCPLCHLMEKTVKNARVDRITHLIQEYNIDKVIHIKGRENCLPDFLSRYSREQDDDLFDIDYGLHSKEATPPSASHSTHIDSKLSSSSNLKNASVLAAMTLRSRQNKQKSVSATTFVDDGVITDNDFDNDSPIDTGRTNKIPSNFSHNHFDVTKLKDEQDQDPKIQQIIKQLDSKSNNLPFVFKNNILYKLIKPSNNAKRKLEVIYLPSSMVPMLLQACHDDPMTGGHFSTDRIYYKIKNQYWWPEMIYTIKQHIRSCILCQQYNISRQKKPGQLRPISPPEGPLAFIGIDYCGPFKRTPRENQYVLVITDHFTRHVTAIALPNCTAEITAQTLFNEYFCKYGIPSVILSDQGSHFRNQLMDNIRQLIGYNHIYSTPYHPQTNGIVERFNSTFVPQISKLQDTQDNNWDEYLQAVVFAYNTGIHKTTKYSPYELLYGRLPRLPIDARPTHFTFHRPSDYFEKLRKTLRIYHQSAKHNIIQQQQMNKHWYDRNRLDPQYQMGDKVLTRIYGLRGKLDPKFSATPKLIIHVRHPIYIVEDEMTHIQSQVHVSDLRPILLD